jgi:hypothetical protein
MLRPHGTTFGTFAPTLAGELGRLRNLIRLGRFFSLTVSGYSDSKMWIRARIP